MNRPVRSPYAVSSESIIAVVDDLPLVPATWIAGKLRSGLPIKSSTALTRSKRRLDLRLRRPTDQLDLEGDQPSASGRPRILRIGRLRVLGHGG